MGSLLSIDVPDTVEMPVIIRMNGADKYMVHQDDKTGRWNLSDVEKNIHLNSWPKDWSPNIVLAMALHHLFYFVRNGGIRPEGRAIVR